MIDEILQWFFLILGIALFIFSLRRQPVKDWLLIFFIAAYFATLIGTIVESLHLIEYPTRLFKETFPSNLLFEAVILPVINMYFYQLTYHSRSVNIIIQGILYTSVLIIGEVIIKKYTSLIVYVNWNWFISFVTVFCFLLAVRFLLKLINRKNK